MMRLVYPADDEIISEHSEAIISQPNEIDIDHINKSLETVNNYSKRRHTDKLPPVLMYEISSNGESCYRSLTLRELFNDVNDEANVVDEAAFCRMFGDINGGTGIAEEFEGSGKQLRSQPSFCGHEFSSATSKPRSGSPSVSSAGGTHAQRKPAPPGLASSKSLYEKKSERADTRAFAATASAEDDSYDATGALRLRDLRRLDFQFNPNEERSVLIRRHAVLFAMDPIRAVVMAKRLILIVPDGADSLLSLLDKYMKEWGSDKESHRGSRTSSNADLAGLAATPSGPSTASHSSTQRNFSAASLTLSASSDFLLSSASSIGASTHSSSHSTAKLSTAAAKPEQTPTAESSERKQKLGSAGGHELAFEMHAFEALLTTVMALETQEYNRVNAQVQLILKYFRSGSLLPIEVQEKMRNRKNDLSVMMRRISTARSAIQQLTEDDEDMALMNLTLLRDKPALYRYPLKPELLAKHDETEELLESYLIDFNSLESKIDLTRNQIQNAEDLVSLRLDTSRNELLIANTNLAILACCFGLGAFVSGIFGMNLDNTGKLQSTPDVFVTVIFSSLVAMGVMFVGLIVYFKRTKLFPAKIRLEKKDKLRLRGLLVEGFEHIMGTKEKDDNKRKIQVELARMRAQAAPPPSTSLTAQEVQEALRGAARSTGEAVGQLLGQIKQRTEPGLTAAWHATSELAMAQSPMHYFTSRTAEGGDGASAPLQTSDAVSSERDTEAGLPIHPFIDSPVPSSVSSSGHADVIPAQMSTSCAVPLGQGKPPRSPSGRRTGVAALPPAKPPKRGSYSQLQEKDEGSVHAAVSVLPPPLPSTMPPSHYPMVDTVSNNNSCGREDMSLIHGHRPQLQCMSEPAPTEQPGLESTLLDGQTPPPVPALLAPGPMFPAAVPCPLQRAPHLAVADEQVAAVWGTALMPSPTTTTATAPDSWDLLGFDDPHPTATAIVWDTAPDLHSDATALSPPSSHPYSSVLLEPDQNSSNNSSSSSSHNSNVSALQPVAPSTEHVYSEGASEDSCAAATHSRV